MLMPKFPDFKPLELDDYGCIHNVLWGYGPAVSEMTFTNLFIWRGHYDFQWAVYRDWLLIISNESTNGTYAFQPIGPFSRKEAVVILLEWLRDERNIENPRIERADERCVAELGGMEHLVIEPLRDHFDYVYRREDLMQLAGSKYRSKRNHINQILRFYTFEYEPLQEKHIDDCLALQEKWCQMNRCVDDLELLSEDEAIRSIIILLSSISKKQTRTSPVSIRSLISSFVKICGMIPSTSTENRTLASTVFVRQNFLITRIILSRNIVSEWFKDSEWSFSPFPRRR